MVIWFIEEPSSDGECQVESSRVTSSQVEGRHGKASKAVGLSVAWFSFTLIARKAGEGYEICFRRRASRRAEREGLSRVNLECERADCTP